MKNFTPIVASAILVMTACKSKTESTFVKTASITESVYSSGVIESENQYDFFPQVNGLIKEICVSVGDTVKIGDPILRIENERQQINNENALLSANYYTVVNNKNQLENLTNNIDLAKTKMEFDSAQYQRQLKLSEKDLGTKADLEGTKLNFDNSMVNYNSALNQLSEFKRQLKFNSSQARNNYKAAEINAKEYTILSQVNGVVYDLNCTIGEVVTPQRILGTIGSPDSFVLELLIDESDILQIKQGQKVYVRMDSYKEKVHKAEISKIFPLMNISSKSFRVQAKFINPPNILYPNMNFEANILINSKTNALLIPRKYLLNDSIVLLTNGDSVQVETGLMDYGMIEILSGISKNEELILPE